MEAQQAFDALKNAMISVPVLALPDFSKTFIVETDASGSGSGAVLMQEGRPIAFISRALSDRNCSKSVYERELIAILFAVNKWRHYLLGRHFIIRTDQRSLHFLMDQKALSEEQQKWVLKLLGFRFEIQYKLGNENRVADALSRRRGELLNYSLVSQTYLPGLQDISDEVYNDPKLNTIVQTLLHTPDAHPGYSLRNGRLFCKGRMVVAKTSNLHSYFLS